MVEKVKKRKMSVGVFLAEAEPVDVEGNKVVLGMPTEFRFHKESLETKPNQRVVEETLREVFQAPLEVQFVITEAERKEKPSPGTPAEDEKQVPGIVDTAVDIFNGRVVRKK